jgi:hypothetical protein
MNKIAALICIVLFLGGCYSIKNRVEDIVHGWDSCSPVSESCLSSPGEFYAIPMIRAINTWRGKTVDELTASWGPPDKIEKLSDSGNLRYVWTADHVVPGEVRYDHDHWKNEWTLVRKPDQTFRCRTFMIVDPNGVVTPAWVDRLGACNEYFSPRPAYVP